MSKSCLMHRSSARRHGAPGRTILGPSWLTTTRVAGPSRNARLARHSPVVRMRSTIVRPSRAYASSSNVFAPALPLTRGRRVPPRAPRSASLRRRRRRGLGGDRLAADARVGERDVLGDVGVEMVAHHEHVEMLGQRVHRERPGRVRRRRQHVRLARDADDVGRVPAAVALGVLGVDRPPGDGADRVLDEASRRQMANGAPWRPSGCGPRAWRGRTDVPSRPRPSTIRWGW
jgi:hypothetical protein